MAVVAIVGRPNVGKSTFFNKLIGERKALVADIAGVTRDRHYGQADWCGVEFTLIDTGGLSFDESDAVEAKVHKQSILASEEADVVICLFDGRDGITKIDHDIVKIFRKSGKDVIYVVNKIDHDKNADLTLEFHSLGVDVIPISAEHNRDIDIVLDKVIKLLPPHEKLVEEPTVGIKIALVGRPNVGKSSIINCLSQEERVVAHERPGTTRDSIDVEIKFKDKNYVFVDTAGIKKRAKTIDKIDKFATLKSLRTIETADVVFVVLDAAGGFARQDIILASHAFNLYKVTAILINKWDLVKTSEKDFIKEVRFNLKELGDLPILCVSAMTGHNCERIFKIADDLVETKKKRIPTSELNKFFENLVSAHPAPDYCGKHVKLNYITQADVDPPVFVLFTNQPKGITKTYRRYLEKGLRKLLNGPVVPIVIKFRSK